jgi:hypothetical protein
MQTTVNVAQAFGLVGEMYDTTPRRVDAYEVAGSGAVMGGVAGFDASGKVGKMDATWKAGNDAFFPEKALGTLFNRPNIGTSRRKQLEGTPPKGYQKIEQLF